MSGLSVIFSQALSALIRERYHWLPKYVSFGAITAETGAAARSDESIKKDAILLVI
jgi:hypothetical protein